MIKYLLPLLLLPLAISAYGDSDYIHSDKLELALALDESLGHFWAIELNLDESNTKLALVHAAHPISELYHIMKPYLEADPQLDDAVHTTLINIQSQIGENTTLLDAQGAINDGRDILNKVRDTLVGDISDDAHFKLKVVESLLRTSMVEYAEAYEDGIIVEVAEFQDGSAFVWRSKQIVNTISADEYDAHDLKEILEYLEKSQELMNNVSTPEKVDASIFRAIYEITGHESSSDDLDDYFANIYELLDDVVTHHEMNPSLAVKAATVAYLDNYEFIEGPLDLVDSTLMEDIEHLLREDLRSMLKQGASKDDITSHVDTIKSKLIYAQTLLESDDTQHKHKKPSPKEQYQSGLASSDILCNDDLILIIRSNDSPACVTESSAQILVERQLASMP